MSVNVDSADFDKLKQDTRALYQGKLKETLGELESAEKSWFFSLSVNEEGVLVSRFVVNVWIDQLKSNFGGGPSWEDRLKDATVAFISVVKESSPNPNKPISEKTTRKLERIAQQVGIAAKQDPPSVGQQPPPSGVQASQSKVQIQPSVGQQPSPSVKKVKSSDMPPHSEPSASVSISTNHNPRPRTNKVKILDVWVDFDEQESVKLLQERAVEKLKGAAKEGCSYRIGISPQGNYQIQFVEDPIVEDSKQMKEDSKQIKEMKENFTRMSYTPVANTEPNTLVLSSSDSYRFLGFPENKFKQGWNEKFKTFMKGLEAVVQLEAVAQKKDAVKTPDSLLVQVRHANDLFMRGRGEVTLSFKKGSQGVEAHFVFKDEKNRLKALEDLKKAGGEQGVTSNAKELTITLSPEKTSKFLGFNSPLSEEQSAVLDTLVLEAQLQETLAPLLIDETNFQGVSLKDIDRLELLTKCVVCTPSDFKSDTDLSYTYQHYLPDKWREDPSIEKFVILDLDTTQLQGGCTQTAISWKLPLFYDQLQAKGIECDMGTSNDHPTAIMIPVKKGEDLQEVCKSLLEVANEDLVTTFLQKLSQNPDPIKPTLWGTSKGNGTTFKLETNQRVHKLTCTDMDGQSKRPALMGLLEQHWPALDIVESFDEKTKTSTFIIDLDSKAKPKEVKKAPTAQVSNARVFEHVKDANEAKERLQSVLSDYEFKKSMTGPPNIIFKFKTKNERENAIKDVFGGNDFFKTNNFRSGEKNLQLTGNELCKLLGMATPLSKEDRNILSALYTKS